MRTWAKAVATLLLVIPLGGCPGDRAAPSPRLPSGSATGGPAEPEPSGAAERPLDSATAPAGDDAPDPVASVEGEEEQIERRVVRRCSDTLALSYLRAEGAVAHLVVSSGQVSFRAALLAGERLRLAPECELEVLEVAPDAVRVRWLAQITDALGETVAIQEVGAEGGKLFLEEMGLYQVDGLTLGVGNVRSNADGTASATVTVFPRNYAADPMQDWDVHRDVLAGQSRAGAVRDLVVDGVGARGAQPGWVRLRWP